MLDYHWGAFHPLQITIYGIMANLHVSKKNMRDANYLLHSSINCCLNVLGSSHILTAQVQTDLGKLQVRMANHTDALKYFKQSFQVYQCYLGEDALETAKSAMQVACIQDEIGHHNEAYRFACLAADTFEKVYGPLVDMTFTARWQKLALAYRLQKDDVEQQAVELYQAMFQRDQARNRDDVEDEYEDIKAQLLEGFDATLLAMCEDAMDTIRMMVIVTLVMEITRRLPEDAKAKVRHLCSGILRKRGERGEIDASRRDRLDKVDVLRVINVTNVKLADGDREELLRWFRMERSVGDQDGEPIEGEVEGAFHHWYREALEDIAPGSANAKYKH